MRKYVKIDLVYDNAPYRILLFDKEGNCVYVSPSIWGWKVSLVINGRSSEFKLPDIQYATYEIAMIESMSPHVRKYKVEI